MIPPTPEAALRAIVDSYDGYRGRGLMPAPDEYQRMVQAIEYARRLLAASPEPPMPVRERRHLHDLLTRAYAVINPEEHQELCAYITAVTVDCDNGVCVPLAPEPRETPANPAWLFLERLHRGYSGLHAPEAIYEADGCLGFDWDVSRGVTVSASLYMDGQVGYASLIHGIPSHGRFTLPDWSPEFHAILVALEKVYAQPPAPEAETPAADDSRGLSIDMLDVDRLRAWAVNFRTYGPDVSHWTNSAWLAGKLDAMATELETAVKEIGSLRQSIRSQPSPLPETPAKCEGCNGRGGDGDDPSVGYVGSPCTDCGGSGIEPAETRDKENR